MSRPIDQMKIGKKLARDLGELHIRARTHAGFPKLPEKERKKLVVLYEKQWAKKLVSEEQKKSGLIETRYVKGLLTASFMLTPGLRMDSAQKDPGAFRLHIQYDPQDLGAAGWVTRQIKIHQKELRSAQHLDGSVDGWNQQILKQLDRIQIRSESLILVGETKVARSELLNRYPALKLGWPDGLNVRPMKNRKELEAVIRIIRTEFKKNPQFGWFVNSPHFLDQVRKEFLKSIQSARKTVFVIMKGKRVVGEFEFAPTPGMKMASLGLNLS